MFPRESKRHSGNSLNSPLICCHGDRSDDHFLLRNMPPKMIRYQTVTMSPSLFDLNSDFVEAILKCNIHLGFFMAASVGGVTFGYDFMPTFPY